MGERRGRRRALAKLVGTSVATAAAAGLIAFAHVGAFDNGDDPFPRSVVTHTR